MLLRECSIVLVMLGALVLTTEPTTDTAIQNIDTKKVNVDIVCDKGATWIKVVARNAKALNQNVQGGSQFGQRNIIDQVLLNNLD